jgi:hypothetical protein
MLYTPQAKTIRDQLDERLNPGFRHSEPARLLADAYSLAIAITDRLDDLTLRRDLLELAINAEEFLLDTLSELRVSKGDVEGQFDELRRENPGWPEEIDSEAWEELKGTRLLRDISDVLCGGGDYWEAIRIAISDVLDARVPKVSDPSFSPRTLYFAMQDTDWKALHDLASSFSEHDASRLRAILSEIQARTENRFAMVAWSEQDVLDAVARERDVEFERLEEATWQQAGVSRAWVRDLMEEVGSEMMDRMTERGWEVLESAVSERDLPA